MDYQGPSRRSTCARVRWSALTMDTEWPQTGSNGSLARAGSAEKKWWTGGELNSRHRDFQSYLGIRAAIAASISSSHVSSKDSRPDGSFVNERQLDPL